MTAGEAHRAMLSFPVADLQIILGGRAPLVLAPHPDDESLGCGGLLAACAAAGGRPAVLVLTDGAGSHPGSRQYPPDRLRDLRETEAAAAAAALGLEPDRLAFMRLADTAAPLHGQGFATAVATIAGFLHRWACGALLAPWRHDPHCDHLAAHAMAAEAARQTGALHLAYPVWGWTLPVDAVLSGPAPNGYRLDIGATLPAKRRAIAAHRSQYAGLIDDDSAGFQLAAGFIDRFTQQFETFLTSP